MSLLQNEEFAIFRLRTSYLAHIHDGVGERLINVDTSFLNDPAYKAAGWSANPPELKRTYSPPIPTTISSEYFKAPAQFSGRRSLEDAEDEEEGGMVTGVGNNDALGPTNHARRRRRKEQLEEDDSSDLSDESDDEYDDTHRPANQIRFAKMPDRGRSGSSPVRLRDEGPSVLVTAPSKPPSNPMQRRGSLGAVEAMKERARRDTTTSSDVSSDNDLDPSLFRRRQLQASQASKSTQSSGALSNRIKEDDDEDVTVKTDHRPDPETERHSIEEEASDSDVSSLASGFSEAGDAGSFLGGSPGALSSSGNFGQTAARQPSTPPVHAQEKFPELPEELPELPPIRPISTYVPVSALSAMLKADEKKLAGPFERFANLSGRGEQNPLYIKIYLPPEVEAKEPLELLLRRMDPRGGPLIVGEAIGFALWRYADEKLQPAIPVSKSNVNWWTLRIVEDEEVDFDFPPLSRGRPLLDFTSNNNRPPRIRARDKPWDEFALVEATPAQFAENEKLTPVYSKEAATAQEDMSNTSKPSRAEPIRTQTDQATSRAAALRRNPVTDPMFISTAINRDIAQDKPLIQVSHAVARTGAPKTLNVHYVDHQLVASTVAIPCTTDTYIAEIHDQACKRLNVDKALYVLKVTNTTTVAPADRTVEALGTERQSLDLVRRRFVGDGTFGSGGSYGSTSPNAPLMLTKHAAAPKKVTKPRHPLRQPTDTSGPALSGLNSNYKRYNVIRKQPLSFAPSHQRVLALDGEYMHVMPSDTAKERLWDAAQGKTTSIHFSSVVGCKVNRKHPKTFRVVVFKERESKRYDFEAYTAAEAEEIVEELRKGIAPYREAVAL